MEAPQDSTEPLKFSVEALQIPAEAPFGAYHVYCMGAQYSKSLRCQQSTRHIDTFHYR